jgi:hypothetical protein
VTVAPILVTVLAGTSTSGLDGTRILLSGAAAGLAIAWISPTATLRQNGLITILGTASTTALGWWAAVRLITWDAAQPETLVAQGMIAGLIGCQGLVLSLIASRTAQRIPSSRRISNTLSPPHRSPCLSALLLDRQLAKSCTDDRSRDDLGEVAAWVYKLQWTMQEIDKELAGQDQTSLQERIVEVHERATQTEDPFSRDRLTATGRHLERLMESRQALGVERERSSVLSDYALAFLEEARAGLVLSHVQPGDHTPSRLPEVLDRLRSHGAEREGLRRAAREMSALA